MRKLERRSGKKKKTPIEIKNMISKLHQPLQKHPRTTSLYRRCHIQRGLLDPPQLSFCLLPPSALSVVYLAWIVLIAFIGADSFWLKLAASLNGRLWLMDRWRNSRQRLDSPLLSSQQQPSLHVHPLCTLDGSKNTVWLIIYILLCCWLYSGATRASGINASPLYSTSLSHYAHVRWDPDVQTCRVLVR